ncbi:MAG: helix-turn-helix domain-containing protein [Cyclobacteriaceae bacterium]
MSDCRFGQSIRDRRKELGITQPHLAELAGVSINTLYKLEKGKSNPTLDVLNKLAEVMGNGIEIGGEKT